MGFVRHGCRGRDKPGSIFLLGSDLSIASDHQPVRQGPEGTVSLDLLFPNAGVVVPLPLLLLLGLILGTLSGFFGVGGGFLITGGLLVFGVPPVFAVGTGLTLIMGSSIINTLKHRRMGNVDVKLGVLLVCGTIPALFLAQSIIRLLSAAGVVESAIRYIYVVVLAILAIFIIYDFLKTRRPQAQLEGEVSTAGLARRIQSMRIPPHSVRVPGFGTVSTYISLPVSGIKGISVFVPLVAGVATGLFAGLLGAGGGTILMPMLIFLVGVPTTVAIGTDLFQIVITGSMGTLIKAYSNEVDLLMVVIMLVSASAGAQLGTAANRLVDPARIRILFGLTVLSGSIAVGMEQASYIVSNADYLSKAADWMLLGFGGLICLVIAGMALNAQMGRRGNQEAESVKGPENNADN
ncbi:MAG TPA: hypothetical protein DCL97_12520 [Dehalococcoidia bacterium]|nr:hypothetical protein [Dehalococcoidia bacterium]